MATNITTNSTMSSTTSTTPTGNTAQDFVNTYNANREKKIQDMYAASQRSTEAGLKTAYDKSMSAAQQARDDISPQYQESMNQLSAEYERQRRNNNMQAASNGLNTGAGSQMALGQMNAYQQGQGRLATAENEAIDRANQNILDLKTDYQNQIAQAAANNDYRQAAALLDEYGAQYDRTMNQASQLAQYGDFSLFASIYGDAAAQQMEKTWALQNPDLAYNTGKLTAEEYRQMTGRNPRGYFASGTSGYKGGSDVLAGIYGLSRGGYGGGYYSGSGGGGRSSGGGGRSYSGGSSSGGSTGAFGSANSINVGAYNTNLGQLGGIHSSLGNSTDSGVPVASNPTGGTTYGNIGNNKITVGNGGR